MARPTIAEKYLRSFTDDSFPDRTRRWIGLVLHRLIETSPDIANYLANFSDVLKGIGQIILTKSEDLKLVAGMVIREMVLAGIEHACFWPTDAIPSAMADFPTHDSQHWVGNFQDFLNDLHELRFIENNGDQDPGVLYAFEITAEDGVHITEETGLIVLLVEGGNLTCVVPPSRTRIVQCFDIPLVHVTNVGVSKSTVRTIRGSQTEYATAALTLDLRSQSWTYLCNAKEYHVQKISILCRNLSEAQEAGLMVMEGKEISNSQAANNFGPKISASQTIDISKPPESGDKIEQDRDVQPAHVKPTKKPMSQTKRKEPRLVQKSRTPTSGALSRVTKPRRPDASESLRSTVGNKPAKTIKGKISSDSNNNGNSVFDIPLDESRKLRKRAKRLVIKRIHSEIRESTGESDQSEYIEPKQKPQPLTKKTSTTKEKSRPKPTASANSKVGNEKKQAKGQKATSQLVPSTRSSLVNKLLIGNRSQGELEQQAPKDSCEVSEGGDVQDDGVVLQSDPPPGLPTLSSHSKPTNAISILKRPAKAPHPSTPEPKRSMIAKIIQHTNEDVVEGGVDSRTRSIVDFANKPGSVRVHETGSPCPIAKFVAEKPSAKQMIERLLESMPAEEEAHESHDSGHLTHSEEVALHSKDLLRPGRRESKTTLVDAQLSNSKALPASPASPAAASRAILGYVTNTVVKKAKANADKAKEASDPFEILPIEQPQRPRTAFTQLLTGQIKKHAQEDHAQMLPLQDSLPLPATLIPRQQVNTNGDLDETLVGTEDGEYLPAKASPMAIVSSPLPSSHSSSSATQVFEKVDTELAEEMEWEASLQPHQRAVADMLTRISRRLVRHLVDSETALRDIIADYERDGLELIANLAEEHLIDHATCFEKIEAQRAAMGKEFREIAKRLEQARAGF